MNRFGMNLPMFSFLFFLLSAFSLCWLLFSFGNSDHLHHAILKTIYTDINTPSGPDSIASHQNTRSDHACTNHYNDAAVHHNRRAPLLKQGGGSRPTDDPHLGVALDRIGNSAELNTGSSSNNDRGVMISRVTSADSADDGDYPGNMPNRSGDASSAAAHFCAKSREDKHHHNQKCDLTKGKWIPHQNPPPYTTHTCSYIHNSNQNCMKNGRTDTEFLQWRWKPRDCELPPFDPTLFLELMRNKKILFVGDSMARNHMESLLCTLVQVEAPASHDLYWMFKGGVVNFTFESYNFTLGGVWAPYLVMTSGGDPSGRQPIPANLYLDQPHELWASILPLYDVAVFSGAYWLLRNSNFFMNRLPVPPHQLFPPEEAPAHIDPHLFSKLRAMEIIWRTVYRHLLRHFTGVAVIRTLSISHFEGNTLQDRGYCNRTEPYSDAEVQEVSLDWQQRVLYSLQMRAYREAEAGMMGGSETTMRGEEEGGRGLKLRLMDVTYGSLLRPDGHPGLNRVQNSPDAGIFDCLHWCQPGPVDTWNQLLLADPEIMCS